LRCNSSTGSGIARYRGRERCCKSDEEDESATLFFLYHVVHLPPLLLSVTLEGPVEAVQCANAASIGVVAA
jgi:hypothetical protein